MDREQRIEAGKSSALYRRWIGGAFVAESPGERQLSQREEDILREVYRRSEPTARETTEMVALWGYALLHGELPDPLK